MSTKVFCLFFVIHDATKMFSRDMCFSLRSSVSNKVSLESTFFS